MADINVGAISEALNNKADRDFNNTDIQSRFDNKANINLSNIPSAYDYVVQTYKNGSSWYREYKSGWVEQGGAIVGANPTVTLLVAMNSAVYYVSVSGVNQYAGERQICVNVESRTTSSFYVNNRNTSQTHFWEVRGYAA